MKNLKSMPRSVIPESDSPYIFVGEHQSGILHLSSDLARLIGEHESGVCRLDDVMKRLLVNDCDHIVLRACFKECTRTQTSFDQYVRMRIDGSIIWVRLQASAYLSELGNNILISGTADFFTFPHILRELLSLSDFSEREVDRLSRFAATPPERTLAFIRLESATLPAGTLQMLTHNVVRALRGGPPLSITAHPFDENTILLSTDDDSLEFRADLEDIVDTVLREQYVYDHVKPVIFWAEGDVSPRQSRDNRIALWQVLSQCFTNTVAPDRFSFREVVYTAQACLDNFSGFQLLMQPMVDKKTFRFTGSEFLLRFKTNVGFGPDRFVRLLEKSELAVPLTHWVFETAFSHAAYLLDVVPAGFTFNINLNPSHTDDQGLFRFIRASLKLNGVPADRVVIEFIETGERIPQAELALLVENCRRCGIRIAIDDFGTCYNALFFLLSVQCDMVKLSREISLECLFDEKKRIFLSRLIEAFRELGCITSLEGIQNEVMFAQLENVHPDQLQGYYFSEPVSIERIRAMLEAGDRITIKKEKPRSSCARREAV